MDVEKLRYQNKGSWPMGYGAKDPSMILEVDIFLGAYTFDDEDTTNVLELSPETDILALSLVDITEDVHIDFADPYMEHNRFAGEFSVVISRNALSEAKYAALRMTGISFIRIIFSDKTYDEIFVGDSDMRTALVLDKSRDFNSDQRFEETDIFGEKVIEITNRPLPEGRD